MYRKKKHSIYWVHCCPWFQAPIGCLEIDPSQIKGVGYCICEVGEIFFCLKGGVYLDVQKVVLKVIVITDTPEWERRQTEKKQEISMRPFPGASENSEYVYILIPLDSPRVGVEDCRQGWELQ